MSLFTTSTMLGIVNEAKTGNKFLLNRFFPTLTISEGEEIHFDVISNNRRLAPFVSPVVQGKIVESEGFETKTFVPAYIKDKRIFESGHAVKRVAGERIGGVLTPMDRVRHWLAHELQDQIDMIELRLETMASEVLTTGAVTIEGELYPTQFVDFGRDPALTVTLTSGQLWTDNGVNPLDDLQDWSQFILRKSGVAAVDVVMSLDVWKVFRTHSEIAKELDRLRGNSTLQPDSLSIEGGRFMGTIDGFNVFVYSGWYINDNGLELPIFPNGTIVMSSLSMQGVRAYGAIRDDEAGYQSLPYYPKTWVTPDPSVRYLMMQSAPLLVPSKVNGSLSAKVL